MRTQLMEGPYLRHLWVERCVYWNRDNNMASNSDNEFFTQKIAKIFGKVLQIFTYMNSARSVTVRQPTVN